MKLMKLQFFILIHIILFLQGCYYWSGSMNDPKNSNYQNPDISHYQIDDFDYYKYGGYGDEDLQEFIEYIEKEHLADLKKKILDENIVLPPITLCEFSDIALIEKYKDSEFSKSRWGINAKKDAEDLTKLIASILQRMHLFQSVSVVLNDDNLNDIIVKPSIEIHNKRDGPLGIATLIPLYLTFGIISPLSYNEIVIIDFKFLSGQSTIFSVEGIGGGYTQISTVWMEDKPSIYDGAQNKAFGRAMHELILNIINHRENLVKIDSLEPSVTDSCISNH